MVQPPSEELSALAQQLLQAHREHQCPEQPLQDRVWQRVHRSAFVAPAALLVEPGAQAATAGSTTAAAPAVAKAAATAGAAKGGLFASVGAKIGLAAGITTSAVTGVVVLQDRASDTPEPSVLLPGPEETRPSSSKDARGALSPQEVIPDEAPQAVSPGKAAPDQAFELTPELQAQLSALSAIDDAIRQRAFRRARTRISDFYTSYASSPFSSDISALEVILQCKTTKQARTKSKARRMLKDPRFRRYWSRMKSACP